MDYTDEIVLAVIVLSLCIFALILLFTIILKEVFCLELDLLKKFITFIPSLFIKLFKIKHRHYYICTGCGDGGLAGNVAVYKCIWCGDTFVK